ncbi:MAG: hypothetical protein Kow0075_08080 [Salibacteraceae bacterium]
MIRNNHISPVLLVGMLCLLATATTTRGGLSESEVENMAVSSQRCIYDGASKTTFDQPSRITCPQVKALGNCSLIVKSGTELVIDGAFEGSGNSYVHVEPMARVTVLGGLSLQGNARLRIDGRLHILGQAQVKGQAELCGKGTVGVTGHLYSSQWCDSLNIEIIEAVNAEAVPLENDSIQLRYAILSPVNLRGSQLVVEASEDGMVFHRLAEIDKVERIGQIPIKPKFRKGYLRLSLYSQSGKLLDKRTINHPVEPKKAYCNQSGGVINCMNQCNVSLKACTELEFLVLLEDIGGNLITYPLRFDASLDSSMQFALDDENFLMPAAYLVYPRKSSKKDMLK